MSEDHNKRVIYITSSYIDEKNSNDYKKRIKIPELTTGEYKYLSVISVVIPNTFLTIQGNETNEVFTIQLECLNTNNNTIETLNREVKLVEGYYDSDQLLNHLNESISKYCKWNDNIDIFEDKNILQFDDNRIDNFLHFKTKVRKNYSNYQLKKVKLVLTNEIFRIFGGNMENEIIDIPIDQNSNQDIVDLNYSFKGIPSILWVTSIQVRLNIVNNNEDSNIAINIPVYDCDLPYITFQNVDPKILSKQTSNFLSGIIDVQFTNQDGYEIKIPNQGFAIDLLLYN